MVDRIVAAYNKGTRWLVETVDAREKLNYKEYMANTTDTSHKPSTGTSQTLQRLLALLCADNPGRRAALNSFRRHSHVCRIRVAEWGGAGTGACRAFLLR